MDQPGQYPQQPPPQPVPQAAYPSGYGYRPPPGGPGGPGYAPAPQVVHIVARRGGLGNAIMFVLGLGIMGFFFLLGLALGAGVTAALGSVNLESMVIEQPYRDGSASGSKIAIIPIEGIIDDQQAQGMHALTEYALQDSSLRAVVLRVDSPGGGVAPSDQIWYEVTRLRAKGIPVIASYGGVAASGGYYVSCGADRIVAEQTCITGSIGVIAQVFTLKGLLDKVGIEPVTLVASGSPEKDVANNIFRQWDERDRQKIMNVLNAAYETFNARVKDGRKSVITDPAAVDAVADGSIYTAQQAMDKGLVDGIGYLNDAIADAEKAARLPVGAASVVRLELPRSLFGSGFFLRGPENPGARGLDADAIRGLATDLASPRLMYLMQ